MSHVERRRLSAGRLLLLRRQSRIAVHGINSVPGSAIEKKSSSAGHELVDRVQRAIDSAQSSVERRVDRLRIEQEELMNLIVDLMEAGKTVGDDIFRRGREIIIELRGLT